VLAISAAVLPPIAAAQAADPTSGPAPDQLIPAEVNGWTLDSSRTYTEPLGVEATYGNAAQPYKIGLILGYGAQAREVVAGALEQARASGPAEKRFHSGMPFYLVQDGEGLVRRLVLLSGELSVLLLLCGESASCTVPDPAAAEAELLALFRAFDIPRLKALYPGEENAESSSELVKPKRFEPFLPDTLAGGWKKSGFSAHTEPSMQWGGAAYTRGAEVFQLGIRHYPESAWRVEREKAREGDVAQQRVAEKPVYRATLMGQQEARVFLPDGFVLRAVGPSSSETSQLIAALRQVEIARISAMAPPPNSE
jgi:hypothetical protein